MIKLISGSLVSTSAPRPSSVLGQVPFETEAFCRTQLPPPLFHTQSSCSVFEEGSIQVGKPCLLKMYADFHIN